MQEHIPAFSCLHPVGAAFAARANQSIHWQAPVQISKRAELDTIPTGIEVEIESKYAYWEKQVLIDALENWLENRLEVSCANLSCPEYM